MPEDLKPPSASSSLNSPTFYFGRKELRLIQGAVETDGAVIGVAVSIGNPKTGESVSLVFETRSSILVFADLLRDLSESYFLPEIL